MEGCSHHHVFYMCFYTYTTTAYLPRHLRIQTAHRTSSFPIFCNQSRSTCIRVAEAEKMWDHVHVNVQPSVQSSHGISAYRNVKTSQKCQSRCLWIAWKTPQFVYNWHLGITSLNAWHMPQCVFSLIVVCGNCIQPPEPLCHYGLWYSLRLTMTFLVGRARARAWGWRHCTAN